MKILLIGANGTIGKVVLKHLKKKHEVLEASRANSDINVDISDSDSIKSMFAKVGKIDAIVCIAGEARWDVIDELSEADHYIGIKSKLMGQVNLVRMGREYLNPNGSMTLTTGILADDPVVKTTSAALVNGGLHSFVKAAALEMVNGQRINVVACGLVEDAVDRYQDYFPGHNAIPMDRVVNAYVRSIEGRVNGEIIREY